MSLRDNRDMPRDENGIIPHRHGSYLVVRPGVFLLLSAWDKVRLLLGVVDPAKLQEERRAEWER